MNISLASLFADVPQHLPTELCQTLLQNPNLRIDRILSQGQSSQEGFWYDQTQSEWVVLLQGQAKLEFSDGRQLNMNPGDYVLLPPHCRHRVAWTSSNPVCVWLAIHFDMN